jgi:hypothetical protein
LAENYTKHPGNSADYSREYGEIWGDPGKLRREAGKQRGKTGESPMGEEFWAVFDSFF